MGLDERRPYGRAAVSRALAVGALVAVLGLATACSGKPQSSPDDPGTVAGFPTDLATSPDEPGGDGGPTAGPDTAGPDTAGPDTAGPDTAGPGGGTATEVTACSLVTAQEAAAALGVASVTTSSGSADECLYQSGGDSVIVGYTTETDRSQADLFLALGGQKIDGVGDEAVQITQPPVTQMHVWTGDKHLQIVLTKQSGDTVAPARSLLDKAMTRV